MHGDDNAFSLMQDDKKDLFGISILLTNIIAEQIVMVVMFTKKPLLLSLVLLFLAIANYSQSASPSPSPPPAEEKDVVKITTSLIQIDVTVKDRKGNVVTDLRRDEIEIFENGKKQDITHFSFTSNIREQTVKQSGKNVTAAPAIPVSPIKSENVRRTIALVVDDLTLSFESAHFVRRALKKFVDEQMAEGDLVAIIRTGAGIGALQQFTNDRRQLYAAIENVKWNPLGSGGIGAFAPLEALTDTGAPEDDEDRGRTSEDAEAEFKDFRTSIFAAGTLGAINYVVRGMSDLPGRKSILLLSDGFRIFSSTNSTDNARVLHAVRRLVDQANRAAVVINTMDARGLQYTGLTAADNTGGRSAEQLRQVESGRRNDLFETQEGLNYLARETGGTAVFNNNDLAGGIRKILDDQSYYLVGYEPDDSTFDPRLRRFHKLVVRVTRPGTTVRYRSGFFGVTDEVAKKPIETGNQKLVNALTSPFAVNEIALRLNGLVNYTPSDGAYIRSLVHIATKDLTFTDGPDESKKAAFDIVALGFGSNGTVIGEVSKTFTLTLPKEMYAKALSKGFMYDVNFPMKTPGGVQLRIAIRDKETDRVGSATQFVEVPNFKKKRLTLSGIVLENFTFEAYQKFQKGEQTEGGEPLADTALRRFKSGSVLNYGFSVFNPKSEKGQQPNLTSQVRLFYEGKKIFEGNVIPVKPHPIGNTGAIAVGGSISLAEKMALGEYVLQVTVVDALAKKKNQTVTQFVPFEIVE